MAAGLLQAGTGLGKSGLGAGSSLPSISLWPAQLISRACMLTAGSLRPAVLSPPPHLALSLSRAAPRILLQFQGALKSGCPPACHLCRARGATVELLWADAWMVSDSGGFPLRQPVTSLGIVPSSSQCTRAVTHTHIVSFTLTLRLSLPPATTCHNPPSLTIIVPPELDAARWALPRSPRTLALGSLFLVVIQ